MVIQHVKLVSTLSDAEAHAVMEGRAARTREVPGLLQTYYAREQGTGELCRICLFESDEALRAFEASVLGQTTAAAYQAESIRAETYEVLFPLHAERGAPTRLAI
jgi:hypothetical protein